MMTKINKITHEQGFTLIELIIVVVILGILAAVGIPRFMNTRLDAWANTCRSNRASLDDAIERYRFDTDTATINALSTGFQTTLVDNNYIKAAFTCPADNSVDAYTIASGTVSCSNINTPSLADRHHAVSAR
jgi:prepilin-type N-terminal cleavage/methylation domain-containing protein